MPRSAALLVALLLGLSIVVVFVGAVQPKMPDFEVYWQAGQRARLAESLYRPDDEHFQYKYLPAFAVAMIPLALLPLPAAKAIWFGLSLSLLYLLLRLSHVLLPERRLPAKILLGVTVATLAKFYAHELVLGQSNLAFAALALLAVAQLGARRPGLAGALLGLTIAIKPYGLIFVPYVLALGQRAATLGMTGAVVACLMLPATRYDAGASVAQLAAWARTVTTSSAPNLTNQDNVSVFGMFAKWLGVGPDATAYGAVAAGALLAVAVVAWRRRNRVRTPEYLEVSLLLMLVPLLSPQGWDYVFVVSTPAIMCLVNYFRSLSVPMQALITAALLTIGLSLFDLMGRAAYAMFMSLSIITLCYFAIIAGLYNLRSRHTA